MEWNWQFKLMKKGGGKEFVVDEMPNICAYISCPVSQIKTCEQ